MYIDDINTAPIDLSYNHINMQVYQLLEDLEAAGDETSPRGLKTKEANMATLDIDPLYPIMNFKPRPFNWKYYAGELAWYLKADNSIAFINNFSSFWKDICPNGRANSNYGSLLFNDHPSTLTPGIDIEGDGVNQLEWVYDSLVKDKCSRQAVAFFNSPYFQYDDNKDFVCTMYIKFWISKNHLEMKVQMRSNDIFFGLTYDAPWFSTIHQSMFLNLKEVYPDLKLGVYYHCADNIHFYERHFDLSNQILDEPLGSSIKFKLLYPLFRFEETQVKNKSKLYISEHAVSYLKMVEDIVGNGINVPKDKSYWKSTLGYLYEITGDSLETNE
jgi:thymidylate synthase